MNKLLFLLASLFCASSLMLSCGSAKQATASSQPSAKLNPVYVTNKARFYLLPTSAVEKNSDALQHITARFGAKEFESDVLLIADSEKLSLTILNDFGATMGELNYNNDLVVFNSELFPAAIKAEYIAADVQFCLYRADQLQAALEAIGLQFVVAIADGEDASGSKEIRSIFDGKKEIVHIEKTNEQITYTNFLRDYSYTLQGAF